MARIEVRVLGPMAAAVDGLTVDLSSRKQRALLALLALRVGQVLSVDRLVDDLWGERPPATARHALQVHVSNLRKLLGSTAVVTQRPGYVLRVPPDSCDASRFEALVKDGRRALHGGEVGLASITLSEALDLWRGPALEDLLLEPFAPQEASRLDELRVTAIEDRIAADLELGRHAELVSELESLVGSHPLRERLWGLLILASYRAGRQVEALRAYTAVRARLRDELGLDPGPELQQLEAAILRQDPALAAPTSSQPAAGGPHLKAAMLASTATGGRAESRRVATVLVAGLVGFDNVARALDPEDLRVMLDRCMARLATVVTRYGGSIDNIVGGELMAVFGAPTAHEDDPERAIRAALDLQRAVRDHADEFGPLDLRVGVSTGEVLFAAAGPPGHREFTVMGDVVNEARRLQAQAAADAVVVGAETRTATRAVVEYRQFSASTFAALDVVPVKHARPLGLGPFLGRDAELDLLLRVWRRSVDDRRPHLVSILGEPGVGKSRYLAEFQRAVAADGRALSGRCVPYGDALTYAPLAEAIRQATGATADDPSVIARLKLSELVNSLVPHEDAVDLNRHLALLVGLDDEGDRAGGLVDEPTLHNSARRFLEALARDQAVCLVVEDVHWADDSLLDLLQAAARRTRGVPLVIVTVARPELVERHPGWGGGIAAFTSISLEPLDPSSTRTLVAELGMAHGLPDPVLDEIAGKSGGNPLFAEELVATIAEGDATTGVPASLTSLLLARLDALPVEQQSALRHASVMGMTFWPGVVHALQAALGDPDGEASLTDTLTDLEQRDLLRVEPQSAVAGEVGYTFKHALIREAVYGSLPRQQRKELHRAAAEWLSRAAGERVGEFSDHLARHALESGQPERALEYLMTAADRSRRMASHRREAALLEEAVTIARSLGRDALVAELHAQRGMALSRVALWAEARAEFEAALATLPADTPTALRRRAEIHCDVSTACFWMLDTAAVRDHAVAALELAELVGAQDVQLAARAQILSADSAAGDVDRVLAEGRTLVADAASWGLDPPYERLGAYSLQLYLTGEWKAAIEVSREAVRTGRRAGDTHGVLWNMPHIAMAIAASGRYDEAINVFSEARRFGEEYELLAGLPRCIAMSAGFHMELFDYEGAEEIQEEARDLGRSYFNPSAVSAGIDLLFNFVRRGDVSRAEPLVDDVAEEVVKGGGWHGWLWRLRFTQVRAEMALARGDIETAMELAYDAMGQSRLKHRRKYAAFGRVTLGSALAAAGRKKEALAELHAATATADSLGNPAVDVSVAAVLLALEPDEEVAARAGAALERVLANLSDRTLRQRFLAADAVATVTGTLR